MHTTTDASESTSPHPLLHTLPAATLMFAFLFLASVLSLLMFGFQLWQLLNPSPFQPALFSIGYVFAHLLRATLAALLTRSLYIYLGRVRALREERWQTLEDIFQAINDCWNLLAVSSVIMLSYTLVLVMFLSNIVVSFPEEQTDIAEEFGEADVSIIEFRLAETQPMPEWTMMIVEGTDERFWVHPDVILSQQDVTSARLTIGERGPAVVLNLTIAGDERLHSATSQNVERHLAIIIEGKLVLAPRIRGAISGFPQIDGLNFDEAASLSDRLSSRPQQR